MTRPAFAIYVDYPIYDGRDAMTGSGRSLVRYCETEAFAKKVAGMLEGEDSRCGGDCSYDVYRVGSNRPLWQEKNAALAAVNFDDVPF